MKDVRRANKNAQHNGIVNNKRSIGVKETEGSWFKVRILGKEAKILEFIRPVPLVAHNLGSRARKAYFIKHI